MESSRKRSLSDLVEKIDNNPKKPRYNDRANLNKSAETLKNLNKQVKNKRDRQKFLSKKNLKKVVHFSDTDTILNAEENCADSATKGDKRNKNKKNGKGKFKQNKKASPYSNETKNNSVTVSLDNVHESELAESSNSTSEKNCSDSLENFNSFEDNNEYPIYLTADNIQYIVHQNNILLVMPPNRLLPIKGNFKVQLIAGTLNIFGYDFKLGEEQVVFSDQSYLLYYLDSGIGAEVDETLNDCLVNHALLNHLSFIKSSCERNKCSVILIKSYTSIELELIDKTGLLEQDQRSRRFKRIESSHSQNWRCVNAEPILVEEDVQSLFSIRTEWLLDIEKIIDSFDDRKNPVIMVCGGMNVGKSTFTRYLVNRILSLSSVEEIGYLDLDPGQPEFSIPGNLSFNRFSSPIIGPPYSHGSMKFTFRKEVLLGNLSGVDMEYQYYDIVRYLYEECDVPVVVNMMGYTETDIILCNLVKIIRPTHLVNICYEFGHNNYPDDITPESVRERTDEHVNFTPMKIISSNEHLGRFRQQHMNRRLSRNITFMSRLSKIFSTGVKSESIVPVKIHYENYAIQVLNDNIDEEFRLLAIYQQFVALCRVPEEYLFKLEEKRPITLRTGWETKAECLGYGFVIRINTDSQTLTLVTPVSNIDSINALIATPVKPPDEFEQTFLSCGYETQPLNCHVISRNLKEPYFSRQEWFKVIDWIYSNEVKDWILAYQFLNIWTNRCRCDLGVEITIPLLKAKIILAEEYSDQNGLQSNKKYLKKMLLERTVELIISLLKSTSSYRHKIAEKIGIDQSINRIRNTLAHGSTKYNETLLSKTFEQLCQYIKIQYWEKEDDQYFSQAQENNKKTPYNKPIVVENEEPEHLKKLRIYSKNTRKILTNNICCKEPIDYKLLSKRANKCVKLLAESFISEPIESTTIFVTLIFLRKNPQFISKKSTKNCKSSCKLSIRFIKSFKPFFDAISNMDENIIQAIFETMSNCAKDSIDIFGELLKLFFENGKKHVQLKDPHYIPSIQKLFNHIEWEKIIQKMMGNDCADIVELSSKYMSLTEIEKLNPGISEVTKIHADSLKGVCCPPVDGNEESRIFTMSDVKELLGKGEDNEDLEKQIQLPYLQSLILPKIQSSHIK